MSVRKRLEKHKEDKVDVDALIDKGAKVKEDKIAESKKWAFINIRIPVDMLDCVDDFVEGRVGITRTGWILEAIQEKLKRTRKEEA